MEIVVDELAQLKKKYDDRTVNRHFSHIEFVIYGVRRGERVKTVCELLAQRPYHDVQNFSTADELTSVLTFGDMEPALLIVEGASKEAGINDMIEKFGPRIFTIGFEITQLDSLAAALRLRGASFISDEIRELNGVRYLSTIQSDVTRDTYMYIERAGNNRLFNFFPNSERFDVEKEILDMQKKKKRLKAFTLMYGLDHIAYRVHAADVLSVGEEIMKLTPYLYAEAHEIEEHDAKTVVFRFEKNKPAMVASYGRTADSLVEKYVNHYGPRVHHMAYDVSNIFNVVSLQKKKGMTFTSDEVIGTREEGIVQIFSTPSDATNEITEYVQRFDGFTGFFSNKNVGNLMSSTRAYQ